MAERVGFEPTYRLITDNSISSRARYGLFATFPQRNVVHEEPPPGKPFFPPETGTVRQGRRAAKRGSFRQILGRKSSAPASPEAWPPSEHGQGRNASLLCRLSPTSLRAPAISSRKVITAAFFSLPCRHEAERSAHPVRRSGDPA